MTHNTITDAELLTYLAGEADPELSQRIESNPRHQTRAQALKQLETNLNRALHLLPRPDSLTLGEYQLGLLPEAEARAVEVYLQQHPHAAQQQTLLEEYLADLEPDEPDPQSATSAGPIDRVKVLIATLLSGGGPGMQPVAGIRGSQEGVYQAGDIQIILEMGDDTDHPARKTVTGLVQGIELEGVTIQLLNQTDPDLLEATQLDEFGNFIIADLAPGSYHLILSSPDSTTEVHIQELQV